jgi:hypothetical protein
MEMQFPVASRLGVADQFQGNMARGIAQLAGARPIARCMERRRQRHGGTSAASTGSAARLFSRFRASGTAHVVGKFCAVDEFMAGEPIDIVTLRHEYPSKGHKSVKEL